MEKKLVIYLLGFICGFMAMLSCMLVLNSQEIFISWDIFVPVFLVLVITSLVLKKKYLNEESLSIRSEEDVSWFNLCFLKKTIDYKAINKNLSDNKIFSELASKNIGKHEVLVVDGEEKDYVIIYDQEDERFLVKEAEEYGLSKGFKKAFWPDLISINIEDITSPCPWVKNLLVSGTEFFGHSSQMLLYKKNDGTISSFFRDSKFDSDHALIMVVEKDTKEPTV